jgi:hypothetical protein
MAKNEGGLLLLALLATMFVVARSRPPAVIVIPPNEPLRAPARWTIYPGDQEST